MPDGAGNLPEFRTGFGRRVGKPRQVPRRDRFRASPALLAGALHREKRGSLRRLVLERLYRNLTPAEQRLCDAVLSRMRGERAG